MKAQRPVFGHYALANCVYMFRNVCVGEGGDALKIDLGNLSEEMVYKAFGVDGNDFERSKANER